MTERRFEPWPWMIAAILLGMGVVLGVLYWLAETHPVVLVS